MEGNKRAVGRVGEDAAVDYYTSQNFRIIGRNVHFGKVGEIDAIFVDESSETLVICEVKYRKNNDFGDASLAVNFKKQNKIRNLTEIFLANNAKYRDYYVRFDVCEVYSAENGGLLVNVIESAF